MRLYIFNPDTDLALANGCGNYTPTEGVRQMMADLAMLPIWYAEPGSYVLADPSLCQSFLDDMEAFFSMDVQLLSLSDLPSLKEPVEVYPWGWNQSFRNMLKRAGISEAVLPDDAELDRCRQLSQRGVVAQLLDVFHSQSDQPFVGISQNLQSADACAAMYSQWQSKGGVVFKEPWSSSGKGLLWCREEFQVRDRNWCKRVIKDQGYVAASPIYNKVQDFAMEFLIRDTVSNPVEFVGYSLFDTDHRGLYKGNALLSNQDIKARLTAYVPSAQLDLAQQLVDRFLAQMGYCGCVGVDMMICQEPEGMRIHPAVEINYRHTMGFVARVITDRFLSADSQGRFMIQHFNTPQLLTAFMQEHKAQAPLLVEQGRVRCGFLPLVPVLPTTVNLAYMEVW